MLIKRDQMYNHPCGEVFRYAGIRLHDIFVFHDGHHLRLSHHSAVMSCCVLFGRLATTSLCPVWKEGQEFVFRGYRRDGRENNVGIVKLGEKSKNFDMLDVCRSDYKT